MLLRTKFIAGRGHTHTHTPSPSAPRAPGASRLPPAHRPRSPRFRPGPAGPRLPRPRSLPPSPDRVYPRKPLLPAALPSSSRPFRGGPGRSRRLGPHFLRRPGAHSQRPEERGRGRPGSAPSSASSRGAAPLPTPPLPRRPRSRPSTHCLLRRRRRRPRHRRICRREPPPRRSPRTRRLLRRHLLLRRRRQRSPSWAPLLHRASEEPWGWPQAGPGGTETERGGQGRPGRVREAGGGRAALQLRQVSSAPLPSQRRGRRARPPPRARPPRAPIGRGDGAAPPHWPAPAPPPSDARMVLEAFGWSARSARAPPTPRL